MLRLQVHNINNTQSFLNDLPEFTEVIAQRITWRIADQAATDMSEDENTPASTGMLAQSILPAKTKKGAAVVVNASYGQVVHSGRKAGVMPPISAIQDWIKVKGIDKEALYPILNKIRQRGVKPQPWVSDYSTSHQFQQRINDAIQNEVDFP